MVLGDCTAFARYRNTDKEIHCCFVSGDHDIQYTRTMDSESPPRRLVLSLAVAIEGGLVILWLVLGDLLGLKPSTQGEFTLQSAAMGAIATLPLMLTMIWISNSRFPPFQNLVQKVEKLLVPFMARLTIVDFALIAVLAGFGEEGLFRGVIQGGLSGEIPPAAALVLASVLFGLLHLVTPMYGAIATIFGLYLGGLYILTGNLVVPVIVHTLYDFWALVYLLRWRR